MALSQSLHISMNRLQTIYRIGHEKTNKVSRIFFVFEVRKIVDFEIQK